MPHIPIIKAAGLHTNSNELSAVPEGALAVANDVVIRAKDVIEPRRGQHTLLNAGSMVEQGFSYQDKLIVNRRGVGSTSVLSLVDSEMQTITDYVGDYSPPSNQRMRSLESAGNVYFTTSKGVYKLDDVAGNPRPAGAPKSADLPAFFYPTNATIGSPIGGFLGPSNCVAYRVVFVEKDANDNLLIGSPSGRCFSTNVDTVNSTNVEVEIPIPSWIRPGMFVRLYRTQQVPSNVDPGDEMGLVKEITVTAGNITAGRIFLQDRQPDEQRGVPLYTNPNSGEGILQANEPPPMANDIAFWNNRAWYANTTQPQRLYLDLLGVGGGSADATGIKVGDVITISGVRFTDSRTDRILDLQSFGYQAFFIEYTTVVYPRTPTQSIEQTAKSLIRSINRTPTELFTVPVRAYYVSGPNDPPGRIVIESLAPNTAPFSVSIDTYAQKVASLSRTSGVVTVTNDTIRHGLAVGDTFVLSAPNPNSNFPVGPKVVASVPTDKTFTYVEAGSDFLVNFLGYTFKRTAPNPGLAWNPELPHTDGTSGFVVQSEAEQESHRVYYSKIQQTEAVPLVNYLDVGLKGYKTLRILPLRDKLYFFKEDGIYTVSGEAPFIVDLLDDTARLIAPDTADKVNNNIYCLSNQGVISVSESGVNIVSRSIEPSITGLFGPDTLSTLKTNSFAFGRETDRVYELWIPDKATETVTSQAFVYNTLLGVWTRYVLNRTFGVINNKTDKLFMGSGDYSSIMVERRNFDSLDYYDEEIDVLAPVSIEPDFYRLTLQPGLGQQVSQGDIIFYTENPYHYWVIDSVVGDDVTLVADGVLFDEVLPLTVFKRIPSVVEWATQTAGSANDLKQFTEIHFLFRNAHFRDARAQFVTDINPNEPQISQGTVEFSGNKTDMSEVVGWGLYNVPYQKRVVIGSEQQYATFIRPRLLIGEALGYWMLSGITINYNSIGPVVGQ